MRCTEEQRAECECDKLGCKGCYYNKEVSDETCKEEINDHTDTKDA